jgi:hypothetical protein
VSKTTGTKKREEEKEKEEKVTKILCSLKYFSMQCL